MPLDTINRLGHAIGQAATAIYRITPVQRAIDGGLAFLQAHGHGDTNDAANQELLQETDLDDISHFGFESFPRQNGETEYIVVDADGGEAAIASRRVLPVSLADLVADEARIYGEDGHSILMKAGGDIECEPAGGGTVKIGSGAAKALVLDGDNCDVVLAFTTWMTAVEAGVLAGGGGVVAPLVGTTIATVTATATKGKGE